MRISKDDEAYYIEMMYFLSTFKGHCLEEIYKHFAHRFEWDYHVLSPDGFKDRINQIIFNLLQYEVAFMIQGYVYLHENVVSVGEEIIPVLRKHQEWRDDEYVLYPREVR